MIDRLPYPPRPQRLTGKLSMWLFAKGDPVAEAEAVGAADPREAAGRSAAVQVDYRGLAVNVDSFTRVLSGRHAPGTGLSSWMHAYRCACD